jgi:hypothetical protein
MRRAFTPPSSASRAHTIAQVKGGAEDRVVRKDEAACGGVSGKFLARQGRTDLGNDAITSAQLREPGLTVCDEPSSSWGMTPSRSFTCRPRAKCHPRADDGHDLAAYRQ